MKSDQTSRRSAPQGSLRLNIGGTLLARNTSINLVGRVLPLLIGIAVMPYVIRRLGPDRFGLLSLAWMVVGYFALFDLGIGAATTKFVAEFLGRGESRRLPELVATAVISQSCLGGAAGALLGLGTPILVNRLLKIPHEFQGQAHWVFVILAIGLPIGFANSSLGGVLAASQRFDLLNVVAVPSSSLTYLLPAAGLALGLELPAIVFLLVLARMAALVASFVLCCRLYPTLTHGFTFNRHLVPVLLGFGGWVAVSGAVVPVLVYFDRFLIGSLISVAAVGLYTPPFMVATKVAVLPMSFFETLFPAISTSAGRGDREWIRKTLVRSLKYMLLLIGPVSLLLAFFARPLLTLWLGTGLAAQGAAVLRILAFGVLANSLTYVPYGLLQGMGRPDLTAKLQLVQLPVHVAIAWFLVVHFGLDGAALAWTIRMALEFAIFIVAGCWLTQTPARLLASNELGRTVAFLAALGLGFAALWNSGHAVAANTVLTALLGVGFLSATWHYLLDTEEKWQIRVWLGVAR